MLLYMDRDRKIDRNKREEIKKCSKTRTEPEILTCQVKKCLFSVGHILLSDTEFKGEGPAPSGSRPPLGRGGHHHLLEYSASSLILKHVLKMPSSS